MQWEKQIFSEIGKKGPNNRILDIGCGRGRISHHCATDTGCKVSGFNIDAAQVKSAKEYAKECGMEDQLDFKVGDHHLKFQYPDNSFDGSYSFQAVWPFFKVEELDGVCQEMYRVMKPGAIYSCSEYLHAPAFDWNIKEHADLYVVFSMFTFFLFVYTLCLYSTCFVVLLTLSLLT